MVALQAVRASNAQIKTLPPGLVALFVGGTAGIGESTVKQFCRNAVKPKVYLVGRNGEAASRIISELKAIQAEGDYSFIQKDLSLINNVDEVCDEIKAKERKLNLLFMTQGMFTLKGRNGTSESLDTKMVAHYYSRIRFTQQMLPLLQAAIPELSRVVSVYAAGDETAAFDPEDLGLKNNFSLAKAANHCTIMKDFMFEEFSKKTPTVSFVHAWPRIVKTSLFKDKNWLVKAGLNALMLLLAPWVTEINESGERHLFAATSERFPPRQGPQGGIPFTEGETMKGSDGEEGSGAYLLGPMGEFRGNTKVLDELRAKNMGSKIWEHTTGEFDRITKP